MTQTADHIHTTELTLEQLVPYEDSNDPNRQTHIVRPPENKHIYEIGMTARDIVDVARALGLEVVALCGYRWIPKHNPEKFEVCDKCFQIASNLMSSEGE